LVRKPLQTRAAAPAARAACQRPALTDRRWRRQELILGLSAVRNDRSKEQEAASATKDAITMDNLNVKAKKYYDQVNRMRKAPGSECDWRAC
jgi:hypothetical protein